jgi:para-aminobenzoate synthetase component 1
MKIATEKTAAPVISPVEVFASLSGHRGSMWLDSSMTTGDWGRYSIIAADPSLELILSGDNMTMRSAEGTTQSGDRTMFFDEIDRVAQSERKNGIGYVSYEATLPWLGLGFGIRQSAVPRAHFFLYDNILRYDHLTGEFDDPDLAQRYLKIPRSYLEGQEETVSESASVVMSVPKEIYVEKVRQVKQHIREGDIYQANITCRFDVSGSMESFQVYQRLRRLNPAPYSAYMNFGDYQVLSSSPERMFLKSDRRIHSSPIKGTIKRGATASEDELSLMRLQNSAKDRAELLMIVDLVRNDLGKIARIGTVRVDNLFRAEVYSSLIHLMADISAELTPGVQLSDIFSAMLPGGSITGAPKKRAVEIINEMESAAHQATYGCHMGRSVYTGCIGYVSGSRADFNLAIRTMIHRNGFYQVYAGGGIVADSDPEDEYEEMLLKAGNLFKAIGVDQ